MANSETETNNATSAPKLSYWRKLGGGSLTLSLIVHGVLLAAGVGWVLSVIPAVKDHPIDIGAGNHRGTRSPNASLQKQNRMIKAVASRISAKNVSTSFSLPEPDPSSSMGSLGNLGGPINPASQIGTLISSGARTNEPIVCWPTTSTVFGSSSNNANSLVGTFYDLKQDPKRKPTGITTSKTQEVIKEFVNSGWKQNSLDRDYFQAPQKLHQSKIYIPLMSADAAPAAFNCENEVQPSRWIIVYRGTVTPQVSGKFRFVGAGDDVLVVRFNNKLMFDHGYYGGSTGQHLSGEMVNVLNGSNKDRDKEKLLRESPMKMPVTFYKYPSTKNWNYAIGGLAVGPTFEAKAGTPYPIEILLSEIPGGLFCSALMIEKIGDHYEEATTGSPILPVFQVDNSLPAAPKGEAPPFAKTAAPWKIVAGNKDLPEF